MGGQYRGGVVGEPVNLGFEVLHFGGAQGQRPAQLDAELFTQPLLQVPDLLFKLGGRHGSPP